MDNLYLVAFAQNILANIPISIILSYTNKFNQHSPSSPSPIEDLIKSICIFLNKKDKKQWTNDKIKKLLLQQTQQLGEELKISINKLAENKYIDVLKKNISTIAEGACQTSKNGKEKHENKISSKNKQNNNNVNNKNPLQYEAKLSKKIKNAQNNKLIITPLQNLSHSSKCICQFQTQENEKCYVCMLCNQYFHFDCINVLHAQMKICIFCHMKNLSPLNQIIQTIFQGKIKKQQKSNEIMFDLSPLFLKDNKYLIQIRCLRLKQCATSAILFPDHTYISFNNKFSRQFLPLIKQSSLKYRKDSSFYLNKHQCKEKGNKIVIETKLINKISKDERIQPQDHLIGIYLIEEKTILHKFTQIKQISLNSFEQSFRLLNKTLEGHHQDIFVQLIKIPLTCIFTGEQIKIPARGMFCDHFQCFDLYNYLIFTAKSQHPRWQCPLCKSPSYLFKIDCLLLTIIKEKIIQSATQILFFSNNSYTILNNLKIVGIQNHKISELNIETTCKRQLARCLDEKGTKKRQKGNGVIDRQKIICLQQD